MLGAKMWYAEWASATDKAIAEAIIQEDGFEGWSATVNPGKGFMAGPVLGYQTEDRRWSFSSAFMLINKFTQDTEWKTDSDVTIKTNTKMKKYDVDLSVSYLIVDWLKAYAGFKYIRANYDVTFESGDEFYKIKYIGKAPTAGLAVAFPLHEKVTIGLQAGLLYMMPDYTWDDTEMKTDNAWGYNVEPNISFLAADNFMLQLGVRYQKCNVKFTGDGYNVTKNDEFLGATLAGIVMF